MPAAQRSLEIEWTCPFCALLCDGFAIDTRADIAVLRRSDCPRARLALAAHARIAGECGGSIDGTPATMDQAVAEAARRLATWRQPLFGGLGTDIAGARALYRLAARTGAICDHADGRAMMHGLRAQQDRGQFTATLAEVRARADLVVCVNTAAIERFPEFFNRCELDGPDGPRPPLVFFGTPVPDGLPATLHASAVHATGDPFADLQQLAALVAHQRVREPHAQLAALAARLRAARYAVFVWEPGVLPVHGALWVEALHRLVATLNRHTRAATFALGGSDGAASVNQVFTWLSGLPLRTRAGPDGLEHEPERFDAQRLLADRAVDGLLWISSFDPARLPPVPDEIALPRIVLGPPAMAQRLGEGAAAHASVFIPVATPGLNGAGHLFRTDGLVVVPLVAARDDGLSGVADVLARIAAQMGPTS
jgi:formylmethanofuran dehydrogenase subunit B